MARYSTFLGRRVEVQYRAGDILLPASGTLVADSGRSVFLEQNFEQRGQHKHFRWEIPYQYLVRIEERPDPGAYVNPAATPVIPSSAPEGVLASNSTATEVKTCATETAASASAAGASGLAGLAGRPEIA
jgi:hypothetical protein